jgi:hypothetical protein
MKLKKAIKISDPLELVGFLRANGTQCQFISMLTHTEADVNKSCPFKGVVKVSRRNGLINMNYNTAVRKRMADAMGVPIEEVEYTNGKTWFKHETTDGTPEGKALPLCVHATKPTGKFYLQYFPIQSSGTYFMDERGERIPVEALKPYFPKEREKSEFKPITCVFGVDSIKQMHVAGVIIES